MPEKPSLDILYAIDFDRCLGDIDKSFNLLIDVLREYNPVVADNITSSRYEVEATGGSFNPYSQLRLEQGLRMKDIRVRYIEKAKTIHITEDGAHSLINYLKYSGKKFCIISYGDEEWQRLKIEAAGFGDLPILIVDSPMKAEIIASWHGDSGEFNVPAGCFADSKSQSVREVVLIDDKVVSFAGLPRGARGYWVSNDKAKKTQVQELDLPEDVVRVSGLRDIVAAERSLV